MIALTLPSEALFSTAIEKRRQPIAIARLLGWTGDFPSWRWDQLRRDAADFLASPWPAEAARLGWTELDLFGAAVEWLPAWRAGHPCCVKKEVNSKEREARTGVPPRRILGRKMPEGSAEPAGLKFRRTAEQLREIARSLRFDPRRGNQLLALADGFERFAERLERELSDGSGRKA